MRRRRLPMSSTTRSDLRETSGPRINRIPPTRPSWRDRQLRQDRELKKLRFLTPSKYPSDLIGSLANRTTLKQLHARFSHSLRKRVFRDFSTRLDAALAPKQNIDSTPSPRHRSGTQSQQGPLTQKIYQKETGARTSVGVRGRGCCVQAAQGEGNQSSVSGRGASAPLFPSRACDHHCSPSRPPCAR